MGKFKGLEDVAVGDRFDWQPYGTLGWPKATVMGLEVVCVTYPDLNAPGRVDDVPSTAELCDDDDPRQVRVVVKDPQGNVWANDLRHFLDMARRRSDG
jgi:hypothetical protein